MSRSPLPSILCLHGSGTSAAIFEVQTARVRRELQNRFSFVFLDAPFETNPGPGVLPVFADAAPYFTWLDPSASSPPPRSLDRRDGAGGDEDGSLLSTRDNARRRVHTKLMPPRTAELLEKTIREQIKRDGRGFAGVMGFSMGGRLAAGLLLDQQLRLLEQQQTNGHGNENSTSGDHLSSAVDRDELFKFAVFICGTSPPITRLHDLLDHENVDGKGDKITLPQIDIPTLHILGLQDPWFRQGELLATTHCTPDKRTIHRLDMGHHLPTQKQDNMLLVEGILEMAKQVGV
ncbi:hypothetical protein PABG_06836 [Paracoccidioides brasiliensis Pb03]|nr:hypothetical protein PABG_06836 [Paracoccidioides brasiliensis Pb03]